MKQLSNLAELVNRQYARLLRELFGPDKEIDLRWVWEMQPPELTDLHAMAGHIIARGGILTATIEEMNRIASLIDQGTRRVTQGAKR